MGDPTCAEREKARFTCAKIRGVFSPRILRSFSILQTPIRGIFHESEETCSVAFKFRFAFFPLSTGGIAQHWQFLLFLFFFSPLFNQFFYTDKKLSVTSQLSSCNSDYH